MSMWLLTVPKTVVIANSRINAMYYVLMLATISFTIVSVSNDHALKVPIFTETRSMIFHISDIMEDRTANRLCPTSTGVSSPSELVLPGGFEEETWEQVSSTCLPVCNTDEDGQDRISCISSSTFAHARSSQEVALWTARHILRSNGTRRTIDTLLGMFADGANFHITYTYELAEAVPYLAARFISRTSGVGTQAEARTVVLSSEGAPFRIFDPGVRVIISLRHVLAVVKDLPPHYGRRDAAAVLWNVFRDGIELSLKVQCYNTDAAIQQESLKMGATNAVPVCYLSIAYVRCCQDFHSGEARPDNAVVVDRAVLIRTRSGLSVQWFFDTAAAVVGLTSCLVLLALPMKFMRWFVLIFLGHLSSVYNRVLQQTFDLGEQTATMAVLLMSNSVSFLDLSDVNRKGSGHPGISRARFEERLKQALQQRRNVFDEAEIEAFAECCFKHMSIGRQSSFQRMLKNFSLWRPQTKPQNDEDAICDIDTYNVHCSYDSAVDLDTAVALFDSDRRIGFMERLFTPAGVKYSQVHNRKARESVPSAAEELRTSAGVERSAPSAPSETNDFVSQTIKRSSLEDKRKAAEAQQRRHERDIKVLDSKIKELEGLDNKIKELEGRPSSDNLLRGATESFEGRLKQLEQAIDEVCETQVRPMWTAVHEALSSIGERVHAFDGRLRDIATSQSPAVSAPSGDLVIPVFQDSRLPSEPAACGTAATQAQSHEADFELAEWQRRFEDLSNRLVSIEAQMMQHMQQEQQMGGIELVEQRFAEKEERFMTAIGMEFGRRMRKMEEDMRELIQASQLVTPVFSDNQSLRVDFQSPRLDSQELPRPILASDCEDEIEQEAHGCSSIGNGMQLAGALHGIATPVPSSRRRGSAPESHTSRLQDMLQNARYQACTWPS